MEMERATDMVRDLGLEERGTGTGGDGMATASVIGRLAEGSESLIDAGDASGR